jgi:hypothetical protein
MSLVVAAYRCSLAPHPAPPPTSCHPPGSVRTASPQTAASTARGSARPVGRAYGAGLGTMQGRVPSAPWPERHRRYPRGSKQHCFASGHAAARPRACSMLFSFGIGGLLGLACVPIQAVRGRSVSGAWRPAAAIRCPAPGEAAGHGVLSACGGLASVPTAGVISTASCLAAGCPGTTWSVTPTGTRATSSARAGSCRAAWIRSPPEVQPALNLGERSRVPYVPSLPCSSPVSSCACPSVS